MTAKSEDNSVTRARCELYRHKLYEYKEQFHVISPGACMWTGKIPLSKSTILS